MCYRCPDGMVREEIDLEADPDASGCAENTTANSPYPTANTIIGNREYIYIYIYLYIHMYINRVLYIYIYIYQ